MADLNRIIGPKSLRTLLVLIGIALVVLVVVRVPALVVVAPFVALGVGLWMRSAPQGSGQRLLGQRLIRISLAGIALLAVGAVIASSNSPQPLHVEHPVVVSSS